MLIFDKDEKEFIRHLPPALQPHAFRSAICYFGGMFLVCGAGVFVCMLFF